jgi:hypothetical protein
MSEESIEEQEIGSDRQRSQFEKFLKTEGAEEGLRALRIVSEVAGLNPIDIGVTWGVTVCVDKDTFVRLNVADYSLFDVRQPSEPLLQRKSTLAYLPQTRLSSSRLLLSGMTFSRGFTELPQGESLKKSSVCWFSFGKLDQLVERTAFADAVKAHVDARNRKIFKGRHNPFVGEAIFG